MSGEAGTPGISWAKGVQIPDEDTEFVVLREAQVIGAILTRADLYSEVVGLDPSDFCVAEYRKAWTTIRQFANAGEFQKISPYAVSQGAGIAPALLVKCAVLCATPLAAPELASDMIKARAMREAMALGRQAQRETNPIAMSQALQRAARVVSEVRSSEEYDASTLINRFVANAEDRRDGKVPAAPTTGLPALDKAIGGLVPENLLVVAGRPGMGKTVTTISIARQAAKAGAAIGYFSLEIGDDQFSARLMADELFDIYPSNSKPLAYQNLLRGQFGSYDQDYIGTATYNIAKLPLFTSFTASPTMAEIEATVSRWEDKAGRKMDGVFIDYSAFVKDSGNFKNNANKQVGEIFLDMKMMARRRKTCVVGVHQLNRGVELREDKRPNMSDLRDSGEIEQHADAIALLFREEYYIRKIHVPEGDIEATEARDQKLDQVRNMLEIIIDKNRAGEPGTVKAWCHVASNALRNMEQQS